MTADCSRVIQHPASGTRHHVVRRIRTLRARNRHDPALRTRLWIGHRLGDHRNLFAPAPRAEGGFTRHAFPAFLANWPG
jgi:hypothetical protein